MPRKSRNFAPLSESLATIGNNSSYQSQLSAEDIQEKLEGYVLVDNIADVDLGVHIRYFKEDDDGQSLFRMGGFLLNKTRCDTYIMLDNGSKKWSVQVKDCTFFRKLSAAENILLIQKVHDQEIVAIKKKYKRKFIKMEEKIRELEEFIASQ